MFCVRCRLRLCAREEDRPARPPRAGRRRSPRRQPEHPPPLAEDDHLAPLLDDDGLEDAPAAPAASVRRAPRAAPARAAPSRRPARRRRSGAGPSPFEMMRCCVSSVISRRNSACVSGRRRPRARICAMGGMSASCSLLLLGRHRDRHARVGAGRQLLEHLGADAPHEHGLEALAQRVQVPRARCASCRRRRSYVCQAAQAPLRARARCRRASRATLASSSSRFSMGVPVSTSRYRARSVFT